ncbi:MAG TPA: hypothetical protein VFY79_04770 [Dehalococcoidia bacterium]|nr:hypothetical protein [Dehalococcoidia bacterium]
MRWGHASLALVCALALATGAAATAGVSAKKKPKKKVAPLALCQLGQLTIQMRNGPKPIKCKPNPAFSKTICQTAITPLLQAAFPSSGVPAGPANGYGPFLNTVGCYWKVGGMNQAIGVQVLGGKGFHTNSLYVANTQITMQQAWQEQFQEDSTGQGTCGDGPTSQIVAKTTVEGFSAYTMDQCPALPNFKADGYYKVSVITKYAWYIVMARSPVTVHSSSDLVPIVEKLMAKYAVYNH